MTSVPHHTVQMILVTLSLLLGVRVVSSELDFTSMNVLTIGAIDASNRSQDTRIQTVSRNSSWGADLRVEIIWSLANIDEKFTLMKNVKSLIDNPVDFLVLNDIFYGSLKKKHHFDLFDTPIVHYQANLSPFASSTPAQVWPSQEISSLCGRNSDNENTVQDTNPCNEELTFITKEDLHVPSKVDVLHTVLDSLKWDSVVILYGDGTAQDTKELSVRLSVQNTTYQVYHVKTYADSVGLFELLSLIYNTTITSYNGDIHLVLMCSDDCIRAVFKEANKFDDINVKKTALKLISKWLLILPRPNNANIEQCNMDMDNILVITYPPPVSTPIYEMSSGLPEMMENVLEIVGSFNDTSDLNETDVKQNASDTFISMLRAQTNCWRSDVSTLLWKPGGSRMLSSVGYVNRSRSLNMDPDVDLYPNVKFGFNRRSFNVSTQEWDPFVKKTANKSLPYEGFCMDLLKELASSLNFTYTLTQPADGEWGQMKNGSFTGLIGQLEREEVDLIVAPISIQPEREMVMDFIFPYFTDYTTVLIKMPDPQRTKWRTFIDPFKWQVLVCIGAVLLFVTTFYFFVEKWNPFYEGRKPQNSMFGDAFWYMYGALLTQGGEHLPDSQTGRTVVSAWWLFSIVMAATYSGNLIAFLTVNKDKLPFESLTEMVQQTDYKWGLTGGTYWAMLFSTSNQSDFQLMWEGVKTFNASNPNVLSYYPDVHVDLVNQGNYAYVADRSMMEIQMAKSCDLQMIKENFLPLQYALGLPNNSAYGKIFSEEMLTIYESGLLQIWKKRWWPKNNFCKGSLTTESKPINIIDVQSAFYLIGIGVVLAGIALAYEWILRYIRSRKERPKPTANGHANGHLPQYVNGIKL